MNILCFLNTYTHKEDTDTITRFNQPKINKLRVQAKIYF